MMQRKKVKIIETQLYAYAGQYTTISECSTVYRVKSGLMIFDRYANLKYKYGRRNFWERDIL